MKIETIYSHALHPSLEHNINKYISEELEENEIVIDIKYFSEHPCVVQTIAVIHVGEKIE